MISDVSVVAISLSIILLCWAVVRIHQKLEECTRSPKHPNDIELESEYEPDTGKAVDRRSASRTRTTA